MSCVWTVADRKILKGGGRAEDNVSSRPLSQMRTTNYMPFIREKATFEKNSEPIGGQLPLSSPPPLSPPLMWNFT